MKKVLALLLVLCTLLGLVACGKKEPASTNSSTPTTSGGNNTSDPTGATEDPQFSMTPEKSPFKGKKLQVYGMGTDVSYTNYDSFGKGNFLWMMKAAMDEWAAINGVTIEYKGAYNQNTILSAINSGEKPDAIMFQAGYFPGTANVGLTEGFTDEEYKKLSDICGNTGYLDMMKYNGKAHGMIYPWTGNTMCYYNKTMFENYGVKTPKEYFMAGEWTWSNFLKCMEEMTKDIDSDGTIDTYGVPADSMIGNCYFNVFKTDESGRLVSRIDDQIVYDFFQLKYDIFTVKKVALSPGKNQIQKNVTYPMYAMQVSDCEPYNFEHLYQGLPNGDELEVVPVPAYDGKGEKVNSLMWNQQAASLLPSCDEREAVIDLLCYVLKCGLKYRSDFSLGALECDYVGIQGKSELSKKWKEAFAKVCEDRANDIKEVANYDEDLIKKIYESFEGAVWHCNASYTKVTRLDGYSEVTKLPPASAVAAIKEKYEASLKTYNELYIK